MSHRRIEGPRPRRAGRASGQNPGRRESTRLRMGVEGLEQRQLMAGQVITEYPVPLPIATPTKITTASDGSLWFTENSPRPGATPGSLVAKLGRVTTSGLLSEPATLLPNDSTFGITVGSDGNLWATEQGATAAIAQVNPAINASTGQADGVTELTNFAPIPGNPNAVHIPSGITSGPQSNNQTLWVTDTRTDAIGEISVNGPPTQSIPEFLLPAGQQVGTEIAAGPAGDNGVYFLATATFGTQTFIGKIDPNGVITEFPVTNPDGVTPGDPTSLAAWPGDAIYFTEANTGRIGKLDLATGVVNDNFLTIPNITTPAGSTPPDPTAIAQFADGSLYITESNVGSVARLTLTSAGAVSSFFQYSAFPTVSGDLPGITSDLSGNPWFTESGTNRIATLALPSAALQAQPVTIDGVVNQPLTNIPIATFTDPDGPSPSTQYTATVNWGDGSPADSNVTLSPIGTSGAFQVLGSHTYTTSGKFTATVTITDKASPRTATVFDAVTIAAANLPGTAGTVAATAGTPFLGTTSTGAPEPVATFPANPGTYSATVDWGDGTALGGATITGPTVLNGVSTDSVIATHTFAQPGTYNGSVTIKNPDGSLTILPLKSVVGSFVVLPPPLIGTAPPPTAGPTGTAGTPITTGAPLAVLASTVGSPNPNPAFYSASINWGDGSPSTTGQVVGLGGLLEILAGSHTYVAPGSYTVSYTVGDAGAPNLFSGTVPAVISSVTGTPIPASGVVGQPLSATPGQPIPLATVSGLPAPVGGYYSATVDYGDGSPTSVGTMISNSNGTFTIEGPNHTYQAPGNYRVNIAIGTTGQPNLATVADTIAVASLSSTPIPNSGVVGQPIPAAPGHQIPLATLSDASGVALQGGIYSATIDYGDGSPTSVGTIVTNPNGTLTVEGPAHVYQMPGNFAVNILIGTPGQPNLASFASTINVAEPPIFVTGVLNPASDSGISNSDGITNVTTPNFFGNTAPGATVSLYATLTAAPGLGPILIGKGVADPSGAYSINTIPLADGSYDISAIAISRFGGQSALAIIESGPHPLVIDTVGPKILDFQVSNTLKGQFQVAYADERSGLVTPELVNGGNYGVERTSPAPRPLQNFIVSSLTATPEAFPTQPVIVTGSVFNGHYLTLRGGVFVFTINAAGITDVAGNALDGEFYGTFPTGDGHPGGNFKAEVIIKGYTPSGPIPFSTANPGKPGTASISPTTLAPKLKKPGLNAPPTSLPGQNTGHPVLSTPSVVKLAAKAAKPKVVLAKGHKA